MPACFILDARQGVSLKVMGLLERGLVEVPRGGLAETLEVKAILRKLLRNEKERGR